MVWIEQNLRLMACHTWLWIHIALFRIRLEITAVRRLEYQPHPVPVEMAAAVAADVPAYCGQPLRQCAGALSALVVALPCAKQKQHMGAHQYPGADHCPFAVEIKPELIFLYQASLAHTGPAHLVHGLCRQWDRLTFEVH
jgi:hypothetical protein